MITWRLATLFSELPPWWTSKFIAERFSEMRRLDAVW